MWGKDWPPSHATMVVAATARLIRYERKGRYIGL